MSASPTTFGLLGMLAVRSYTGYELTQQLRRSLRFVWSSSEGHLYREQRRLVDQGWARRTKEVVGGRTRTRYEITDEGEHALADWLATEPRAPQFDIEGMLRLFHGSLGSNEQLITSLEATARDATAMLDELAGFAASYLEPGGPLELLEQGRGGPGDRVTWEGRELYPERLPVIAMVIDGSTRLLETLAAFASESAEHVRSWGAADSADPVGTRARLEAAAGRAHRP